MRHRSLSIVIAAAACIGALGACGSSTKKNVNTVPPATIPVAVTTTTVVGNTVAGGATPTTGAATSSSLTPST